MTTLLISVAAAAVLLTPGVLRATVQDDAQHGFGMLTTDGGFVRGRPVGLDAKAGSLRFLAAGATEPTTIPLDEVVGIAGRAPRVAGVDAVVRLVGGDELRGELGAGDASGETLVVRSPVLGPVSVRVDRLQWIVFPDRLGDDPIQGFSLPDGVEEDEAVFVPARRGFDMVVGLVHRFREDGLLFQPRGQDEPLVYARSALAGFALRGGDDRAEPANAVLLTAAGDRLRVDWTGLEDGAFTFRLESGEDVTLRPTEVASVFPLGAGRTHLSDLPVVEARERSWFDDDGPPLWPYRLDRAVGGAPLRAGDLGFAKGIGVHARSALAWKVPEGAEALVGLVALDDSTLELPVRGAVIVRVRQGDEVLFEHEVATAGRLVPLGRLPVEPGQTLRLEVDFGAGLDLADRADWLGVTFVQ